QRQTDGSYEVKTPTPGAHNDGSGIPFIGLSITVSTTEITEGETFAITFTAATPVVNDLTFSFTLSNSSFNSADYTGNLNVLIPAGQTVASALITVTDDSADDGDEVAVI